MTKLLPIAFSGARIDRADHIRANPEALAALQAGGGRLLRLDGLDPVLTAAMPPQAAVLAVNPLLAAIVERIARMLDHPITLRSEPGKGSIFALDVPTTAPMPALKAASGAGARVNQALAGLTVLAIDNEPAILDGMSTLLNGWGCTIMTASSLKEAEAVVRAAKAIPDVLLADYHLDDADGMEAIVALRWKFGKPVPAVLITADRSPELRAEADEKNVTMLPKPLRPAALRALLAQMLTRRDAAE